MNENLIKCDNLSAWYDGSTDPVLDNISFSVPASSNFTLVEGENGSGKTTLFRILRGLYDDIELNDSGKVRIGGINPRDVSTHEMGEDIGMVFQRPSAQVFNLTVLDEVQSGPLFLGYDWETVVELAESALDIMNIKHLEDKITYQMSSGQTQKTVLSAILAMDPDILLLDEPTSYLDPPSRSQFLADLHKISKKDKKIIISSHRDNGVRERADYSIMLKEGKIKYCGDPKEVSREIPSTVRDTKNNVLSSSKDFVLNFYDVSVEYSTEFALKEVSLSIPTESITCVFGPNGAGKTTLAKVLTKTADYTGDVTLLDDPLEEYRKPDLAGIVGYVTQDPAEMLFQGNVFNEIQFGIENIRMDLPTNKTEKIISDFEISQLCEEPPGALSTGQQRIVSIAVMTAMDPEVLIIDEPELALDTENRSMIVNILNRLSESTSVIVLTHDLQTFLPITDDIIVLKDGEKILERRVQASDIDELNSGNWWSNHVES